ncbi:EF-Tu C-terminal domain-related protein [Streptomyces parvulus]|uniref:EF-Tu C-terminal domain-related protein n=1 Tax=Streptomyces parvulus TaxID=146923 RepID=UPI0033AF0830
MSSENPGQDYPYTKWEAKFIELAQQMNIQPDPESDQPFLLSVDGTSRQGTAVSGRVERGTLKPGDEIEILGLRSARKTACAAIENGATAIDEARAGDEVTVLLAEDDEAEKGQVLATPGTITAHTEFRAQIYLTKADEGGRRTPFFTNCHPQFHFHTTGFTGTATLPEGVKMAMPGEDVGVRVELSAPVAMEKGLRFLIHDGPDLVGVGVVAEIIA